MKTTKKVWNKLFGIFNLEDRGTDVIIVGLIIVLLLFFSAFLSEPAKSNTLMIGLILAFILLSVMLAMITVTLVSVTLCVTWDLILFIKGSIERHGFVTVLLKVMATGFLICSSYALIQASQPGTHLYAVFRTEQPNPFVVIVGFMVISLFALIKKL